MNKYSMSQILKCNTLKCYDSELMTADLTALRITMASFAIWFGIGILTFRLFDLHNVQYMSYILAAVFVLQGVFKIYAVITNRNICLIIAPIVGCFLWAVAFICLFHSTSFGYNITYVLMIPIIIIKLWIFSDAVSNFRVSRQITHPTQVED